MEFRVIVCGSRDFDDSDYVKKTLDEALKKFEDKEIIIMSGHGEGADYCGEIYSSERGLRMERYPAQWKKYGKRAGPIRNKKMAEVADYVIAFSAGGPGTKSMLSIAEKKGIPTEVYDVTNHVEEDTRRPFGLLDIKRFLDYAIQRNEKIEKNNKGR